jgi:hypothetical protein
MGSYAHDISRMTVRLTELKYNSTKPSTILAYVNVQVKKVGSFVANNLYFTINKTNNLFGEKFYHILCKLNYLYNELTSFRIFTS